MQQTTINFAPTQAHARVTLQERVAGMGRTINRWLDTKSEFYSRVADFAVTRRTAIRVNLVTLAMTVLAVAAETAPAAVLAATLCVAWIMYRVQSGGKGGTR